MEDLIIQGTNKTPAIEFKTNGEFKIEGRSIPEDSIIFYSPVFSWIREFNENLPAGISINVNLEYINTSSSKILLEMFKLFDQIHHSGKSEVKVTWLYEYDDEDSREEGNNYKSELNLPFTIIAI